MNKDLKRIIKNKNLKLWQVAEKLGLHDSNFSRMLRYKLNDEQLEKINNAIEALEKEKYGE